MTAYYNEFDPYAAQWLRNLIDKGLIAKGEVDERSIVDVSADDLVGFEQCHFFAGIGGWSYAARLAGWDDDRQLWTGSCPCQPFSFAGQQKGTQDERHLWPDFFRLISARRPDVVMGEQVAAAVGKDWLDGVQADLESIDYACGAAIIPACAVDAPHRRDRLWFVADAACKRGNWGQSSAREAGGLGAEAGGVVDDTICERLEGHAGNIHDSNGWSRASRSAPASGISLWSNAEWSVGADGKARRVEPSIRLLAHGVPARVGRLRAYGNAIVPQVAAEVIAAFMETRP